MYEATIPLTKVMINAFPNSFDSTANTCVTLTVALDGIRNGVYEPQVIRVRKVLALQGKADYDRAKAHLPAFTFCGTFTPTRARAHLQQYNGIALGDLDDLSDVKAVKQESIQIWGQYSISARIPTSLAHDLAGGVLP